MTHLVAQNALYFLKGVLVSVMFWYWDVSSHPDVLENPLKPFKPLVLRAWFSTIFGNFTWFKENQCVHISLSCFTSAFIWSISIWSYANIKQHTLACFFPVIVLCLCNIINGTLCALFEELNGESVLQRQRLNSSPENWYVSICNHNLGQQSILRSNGIANRFTFNMKVLACIYFMKFIDSSRVNWERMNDFACWRCSWNCCYFGSPVYCSLLCFS